ncbi:MAG: ABC transporter ATP-binding protein [Bryobacteraceae bacterium]|nr:ABC transporter ATP-binding protein [Bryobacteraceae bacterium]
MEEEVQGKLYDWRLIRRLMRYMKPYWRIAAISLLLVLVHSAFQVVAPLLTKTAVDRYLVPAKHAKQIFPEGFLSDDPMRGLAQLGAIYMVVIVATLLIQYVQSYMMQWTGQRAMFDLRRDLMACLQKLDIAYYDRNPAGRLVTRVTTDVDVLNELFATGLVTAIADILLLSFVLIAMFQLSPPLTLLLIAGAPVVIAITFVFRRRATESYRRIRVAIARINAYIQERVGGISVVQLFNREARTHEEFTGINRTHMVAYKDSIMAYGWFYPLVEFTGMIAVAGLLVYGGYQIHQGRMSLGILLAFFQYGMRFFRPVQDLSEKYNVLQSAMAASERIFQLLDTEVRVRPPENPKPFPEQPGAIEFDQVSFAYKDDDWVLRDIGFRIEPGETIAIVGHTGAGKTTLINLLLRFYDARQGVVRIGGIDVREFDPTDLRRHFGVVLQDPHLFTGTIEDNIRLGTPWIDNDDLISAAEQVNLLEYIRSLPEGFSHPVRERGSGLSTGQKQLISFARALAHNPRFLILDEATSSVDTDTEYRVRQALSNLVEGRTSIIIAHRLSTIQSAHRIFVMHKGHLREVGTHQQLLATRGIYWKLYQLQYKDQEIRQARELAESRPLASGE